MATKTLTDNQKKARVLKALGEAEDGLTAPELLEATKLSKADVNNIAKLLVKAGKVVPAKNGRIMLAPDEEDEAPTKPAKKPAAPAKSVKKPAKKVAPPVEEDDDDDDIDIDLGDDDDEDADADIDIDDDDDEDADGGEDADEDGTEDDDEEGFDFDDDDGQDPDDDEDDEPAPAKKKAGKKASPPHKQFTMAFKPIDTLTDEELEQRIEMGLQAAESLVEQKYPLVAEMIMRSVAKARRQLNKRQ